MKSLLLIITITFFSAAVFAQAGKVDSTFGQDGIATTQFSNEGGILWLGVHSDGKILAAGWFKGGGILAYYLAMVRYNTDGTLDSSYNYDGIIMPAGNTLCGIALQPDEKIIVSSVDGVGNYLARYNPDGSHDNTFSNSGLLNVYVPRSFVFQPDGRIVTAGDKVIALSPFFTVARCNSVGILDNSFGLGGVISTKIDTMSVANAAAIQSDGKIVVAGLSSIVTNADYKITMVRYDSVGSLDSNFGADGIVKTTIGTTSRAYSVIIQTDGKIVLSGSSYNGVSGGITLVRYDTDGALDSSFSEDGIIITTLGEGGFPFLNTVIQQDGKIVVAGAINDMFALARFNSDGTPDSSFGSEGTVTTEVGIYSAANSLAFQPDGKMLAGGYKQDNGSKEFAVVRYISGLEVGIISFSAAHSFLLIYPNPIQQTEILEYTLTKNETLTVALYDINGRLVQSFFTNEPRNAGTHKETLNMPSIAAGNYFLTLSNGAQKMTVKIVKQ